MKKSQLYFSQRLPNPQRWGSSTFLIYDRVLERQPGLKKWIQKVPMKYGVKSGEKLKSIEGFSVHIKKIMKAVSGHPLRNLTIVVLGGGSVGDFGGFVASILKRGVRLIHIPSTWLSAVDSSHGGKNGLNIGKVKNQVGTFYCADEVHLVREVLMTQPEGRVAEALGEVIKISLIAGGHLWRAVQIQSEPSAVWYWQHLPRLINAKLRIVASDPTESKGLRHVLNLGHTLGHVWESQMKIPHGLAVLMGTSFALEWSLHRGLMKSNDYYQIRLSELGSLLPDRLDLRQILAQTKDPRRFLLQDKKIGIGKKIRFVFLKKIGQALIEEVSIAEILREMQRQAQ